MSNQFKIGDVVILKSGSPDMTVVSCDDKIVKVVYYNFNLSKLSSEIKLPFDSVKLKS